MGVGTTAKRRWVDLSGSQRRLLLTAAAVEGVMKLLALNDMRKRPGSEIHGPKWLWATSVTVVSSAGILPATYFLFGRRRS